MRMCELCASMENAQDVLDFWFGDSDQNTQTVDSRMERWFSSDAELDADIEAQFGELVERASTGELQHWAEEPEARLALIILLDQFRRNIYRGTPDAFALDGVSLKLCVEGTIAGVHDQLTPEQRIFFFMPLQHAESLKIQDKSVSIYNALAESVTGTLRETFATCAQFAELHRDIIAEFGRFPHRNVILRRENSSAEATYLSADAPSFGQ